MLDGMPRLPGDIGALPAVPSPRQPQTRAKVDLAAGCLEQSALSRPQAELRQLSRSARGFATASRWRRLRRRQARPPHPDVLNAAYNKFQFWDGRAASLESRRRPMMARRDEHALRQEVSTGWRADESYRSGVLEVFGGRPASTR